MRKSSIHSNFLRGAAIWAALAILQPWLAAQSSLGTILGRITDPSGAALAGARVTLRNENTNVTATADTSGNGDYVFPNLIPGSYQVTITFKGFAEHAIDHIVLRVDQTAREDATLEVGTVATSVAVTAGVPLVQTDTSSVGSVIESAQIKTIPLNGRTTIFGLLALAPGVQSSGTNARIAGDSWGGGAIETMDGIPNMEMENMRLSNADPSLDSIQEFKVVDSTGSAEYGSGTVQVILSTKSGTNSFHGSAFEYNRVAALSAKNFFATGLQKPPFIRNEFGGSVGGPIKRNKLFFFASYEAFTYRSSSTNLSAQPTAALLAGNFAGLASITDPLSGAPFPNNQIPNNRINPVSQAFFSYFSAPNLGTTAAGGLGNNFVANVPIRQDDFRYEGRVDYNINAKNTLFARYYYTDQSPFYSGGTTPKWGGVDASYWLHSLAVNYTRIFTPGLVNVSTFGFFRESDQRQPQNFNFAASSVVPGLYTPLPGLGGLPTISITGFAGLGDNPGSGDVMPTYQFADTLTWIKGSHTAKAGFSLLRYQFHNWQNPSHGTFSYTGQYSRNALADFLLGDLAGSSEPLGSLDEAPTNYRYGFFVQDDWRIAPRLTLNIGLRYELPTLYVNTIGTMSNWYPNLNQLVVIKGTYDPKAYPTLPIVPGSSVGINTGNYIQNDLHQFAPRIGLAYRPLATSRIVIRGGYGMYYNAWPWTFGSFALGNNPPFAGTLSFEPGAGTVPTLLFNNAFPGGSGATASGISVNAQSKYQYPLSHEWNFTLESQLSANTAVRATYFGMEREHATSSYTPNNPPPAPGPVQPLRPYQPFGQINYYQNVLTANEQQLQLSLLRHFASGLSFGAEYAITKYLNAAPTDTVNPTDPRNLRLDRGNDPNIRRHYLVANYVYELPFGKGKKFLRSPGALVNAIAGGWQTTGIVTLGSGLPYSVSFTSSVQGWPSSRADIVGNPGLQNPTLTQWFNPAAFAVPQPFTFGNSAPYSLYGPRFVNWDTGVFKNFQVKELFRIQFRSEFFNALNHPNFGNPAANISVPAQVGRITSASSSRNIQFALRLEF